MQPARGSRLSELQSLAVFTITHLQVTDYAYANLELWSPSAE